MASHKVIASDARIDSALRKAQSLRDEPVAQSVEYLTTWNLLIVCLTNGRRLALPLEDLQQLNGATPQQLAHYELVGGGTGISFPDLDADFYVPALIAGVYGTREWMKQLGRKGGLVVSKAKREAARANGVKGGRPRKIATAA